MTSKRYLRIVVNKGLIGTNMKVHKGFKKYAREERSYLRSFWLVN